MDISIVYVSYNSKYYILQSIKSLLDLKDKVSAEIIVVDNASQDGTSSLLEKELAADIILIKNKENKGFGKACNQGLHTAKGKYVLFLNPDTVVEPGVVLNCLEFAKSHLELGVLGVQMVNGKQEFLPESKRGFPSPKAAFFKMSGLSKLFPNSENISIYHQGKIQTDETAEVDVVSGAFMMGQREKLNLVKGFDEDYFMYGEDIDLSYRMTKSGHTNYYLGSEKIIHYKGKSSNKSEYAYVSHFYGAMSIFAKKHLQNSFSWLYMPLIFIAIRLRSLVSFAKRFLQKSRMPIIELLLFSGGMFMIKYLWARFKFHDVNYYDASNLSAYIWIYAFIWIAAFWICLSYRFLDSFWHFIKGFLLGLCVLLGMYALLNIEQRPSRAIILLGAVWVFISGLLIRWIYKKRKRQTIDFNNLQSNNQKIAILGTPSEVEEFFTHHNISEKAKTNFILFSPSAQNVEESLHENHINSISQGIEKGDFTSLICFESSVDLLNIYAVTSLVKDHSVTLGIIGETDGIFLDTMHIKNDRFEVHTIQPQIQFFENKVLKRLVDIVFAIFMIISKPFISINLSQIWEVFIGKKTFVSYNQKDQRLYELPKLKRGIFEIGPFIATDSKIHSLNLKYALQYTVLDDIKYIVNAL